MRAIAGRLCASAATVNLTKRRSPLTWTEGSVVVSHSVPRVRSYRWPLGGGGGGRRVLTLRTNAGAGAPAAGILTLLVTVP